MSKTPLTDHYTKRLRNFCGDEFVPIEFARTLEIQRDRLAEELDGLKKSILDLSHPNMKLLLEERDKAVNNYETAVLREHRMQEQRDRLADELNEWKTLTGWGGTPEIINDFIKGQQSRIYAAQEAEEQRDRLMECIEKGDALRFAVVDELVEQRDRLVEVLNDLWHNYSLTGAAYELIEKALTAVKGEHQ
jgi:hypothetical protein